ncbi:MAG: repair protein RecO [Chloroflexia bacterium]|jgi:DNA repair protein RecO (recombination protein O)|nr:repair protein RecO [Chloroflexia bacterium]
MSAREHLYKSEAVVIKRSDLGEADKILTIFTPHFGKLRVVAKGVRKVSSRLAGHVELFTRSQMLLAKARNLDIVTQSETLDSYRPLHDDLERVAHAYYAAELLDALTPDEHENYAVYKVMVDSFGLLSTDVDPDRVLRWLEMQLLGYLGYAPEITKCVECRKDIEPIVNTFSPALGGVLCSSCRRPGVGRDLSVNALKMLRLMQRNPYSTVSRVRIDPDLHHELQSLLQNYLTYILERELRSTHFIKGLRAET